MLLPTTIFFITIITIITIIIAYIRYKYKSVQFEFRQLIGWDREVIELRLRDTPTPLKAF